MVGWQDADRRGLHVPVPGPAGQIGDIHLPRAADLFGWLHRELVRARVLRGAGAHDRGGVLTGRGRYLGVDRHRAHRRRPGTGGRWLRRGQRREPERRRRWRRAGPGMRPRVWLAVVAVAAGVALAAPGSAWAHAY